MIEVLMATAAAAATGTTSNPNSTVIAACIVAIPATLTALASWRSSAKGRKQEANDHGEVEAQFNLINQSIAGLSSEIKENRAQIAEGNLAIATVETAISALSTSIDIRLDSIEDVTERHLGWHRIQAEDQLEQALKKESISDNPTNTRSAHPGS